MESVGDEVRAARKRLDAITVELQVDEVRARRSFALAEREGEGGVDTEEIASALSGLGVDIADLDLRIVVDRFLHGLGRDSGTINFEEYLFLYKMVLQSERIRRKWELRLNMLLEPMNLQRIARETFRQHEEKYQGYISEDDLPDVLRSLRITLNNDQLTNFASAATMDGKVEEMPFATACVQLWETESTHLEPLASAIRWTHREEKAEADAVFALAGRDALHGKEVMTSFLACGWDEAGLHDAKLDRETGVTLEKLLDLLITYSICKPCTPLR